MPILWIKVVSVNLPYIYLIISETEFLIYLLISLGFIQWNNHAYNSYIIFYKVFFLIFVINLYGIYKSGKFAFCLKFAIYSFFLLCMMYHLTFSWLFLSYKSNKITRFFLFIYSQFPLLFKTASVCVCVH